MGTSRTLERPVDEAANIVTPRGVPLDDFVERPGELETVVRDALVRVNSHVLAEETRCNLRIQVTQTEKSCLRTKERMRFYEKQRLRVQRHVRGSLWSNR